MRHSTRQFVTICIGIACVVPAKAQPPDRLRTNQRTTIPNVLTMTLRAESVHRNLELSRDQISRICKALDEVETPLWRMRDLPPQQQTEAAALLLRKLTEATSHILLPQQLERLNQIILQTQGIRAVLMPSVADRLNLTVAQQSGIRQIVETLDRKLRQRNRAGSLTRNSPPATGLRMDAELQISGLLRPSQNRLLRRLMGPPFDLKTVPQVACRAPEIRGIEEWINSEPKTLAGMRGKVVALHFYAAGCINCIRNLPHYNKWSETFAGDRFAVIGIHTPETQRERVVDNVRSKAEQAEMQYPIAVDNKKETWNAWGNHVWPAVYLIDKRGFVRYWWYGELNWQQTEGEKWMRRKTKELLAEDMKTQDMNNRRL